MLVVAVEEVRGGMGGVRSGNGGRKRGRVDGGLVYVIGFRGLGLCGGARLLG